MEAPAEAPPEVKLVDVYRGVVPLVGIQLGTLLLVMLLPFLTAWLPILALE